MSSKSELSRITIDLPREEHRRLKKMSADIGKSMKQIVVDAIRAIEYCSFDHTPNAETIKAMQNAKNDKGLIRGKKAEDIAKKFGLSFDSLLSLPGFAPM